uniref:Uncharacterized protein n=1 Tax=Alcaligenes faecalis TaxID=511 RepID=E7DDH1_ALCFA|nr:hypothetical protein [Alcaligenes faecalis]
MEKERGWQQLGGGGGGPHQHVDLALRFSHCLLFNPSDTKSAAYNPLLEVRRGAHKVRDVQNIADILVDPEGALDRARHIERRRSGAARQCDGQADPLEPKDSSPHHDQPQDVSAGTDLDREDLDGVGALRVPQGQDAGPAAPGTPQNGRSGPLSDLDPL